MVFDPGAGDIVGSHPVQAEHHVIGCDGLAIGPECLAPDLGRDTLTVGSPLPTFGQVPDDGLLVGGVVHYEIVVQVASGRGTRIATRLVEVPVVGQYRLGVAKEAAMLGLGRE